MTGAAARSRAEIDLAAIRHNTGVLRERAGGAAVMAVVKADAYGHGLVPCARAALSGGATWLGTAFLEEALELRAAGVTEPVLAWLFSPGEDLEPVLRSGIDLGVYSEAELARVAAAALACGVAARVHLKADTGLSRGGSGAADWPALCAAAARAEAAGSVHVVGVYSHLACAEQGPGHPANEGQLLRYGWCVSVAEAAGLTPLVRHLANSAATLLDPRTHFDLVRPGIALYGLGAASGEGLRPAMTLASTVALAKDVPAGSGVSYGHHYVTGSDTRLALVPLGYADGIPRSATGSCEIWLAGRRYPIQGTVCMDQVVLDVGSDPVSAGDRVVVFGPGDAGEPTAADWARALGTIDYDIVTRIGPRVPRTYLEDSS